MAQRSVLIVDDDPALTEMLSLLFRVEGYRVIAATDGLRALHLFARGTRPDLMLLDMHMEGLDGWNLSAEIKRLSHRMPTLVITADPDPARCAEEVGADAYLAKPLDLRDVLRTVERLLDEKARREAAG